MNDSWLDVLHGKVVAAAIAAMKGKRGETETRRRVMAATEEPMRKFGEAVVDQAVGRVHAGKLALRPREIAK